MNAVTNERMVGAIVVGAGPAGLATSWHLKKLAVEHVVLERETIGTSWRSARWDSFTLITPTWSIRLPGLQLSEDENGFLTKHQFVKVLTEYAADLPVRSGVDVLSLSRNPEGWTLATSEGEWSARAVVIASGGLRLPRTPAGINPPPGVTALHSVDYRHPDQLPPGAVLIVGSGQSGTRIAHELRCAGRRVFLATGSAGGVPRSYRGRDTFAWLRDTGSLELSTGQAPVEVRRAAQPAVNGIDASHNLVLRQLASNGVTLLGRLLTEQGGRFIFADDLAHNLKAADAFAARFRVLVDSYLRSHPEQEAPSAQAVPAEAVAGDGPSAPTEIDAASEGISTMLWCTGMRADTAWMPDDMLDDSGIPKHHQGRTVAPGVYAVGFPWLTHRASGILYGIGTDAAHIAEQVRQQLAP